MWDLVKQLLFESPHPVVAVLVAVAAVAVLTALRRRGLRRRCWFGVAAVLVLVAVGGVALSCLVVTDRERVIARTRVLLGCTAPLDRTAMRRMLHYDASFVDKSEHTCFNATRTIDLLETLIRRVPIQAHQIREEAASILSPRVAESSIRVWTTLVDESTFRQMGLRSGRVASDWRLRWRYDEDEKQWRVTQIQCTRFLQTPHPPCSVW